MKRHLLPSVEMRLMILEQGIYSTDEKQRIYNKWFSMGPRYKFQAVDRKWKLTDKIMCDIGCGYGTNLLFSKPGSYGIEVEHYTSNFGRSIGLNIEQRDFLVDTIADLPKVEAVWCSAVIEHVESVHAFLRRIAFLLQPNGLVVVHVPTIPLVPFVRHLPKVRDYTSGYLAGDHINAFTPSTLRFFCERAGFQTLEVSPYMSGLFSILNNIPMLNRIVSGCIYVGHKIPNWNYPATSSRLAVEDEKGFIYKRD